MAKFKGFVFGGAIPDAPGFYFGLGGVPFSPFGLPGVVGGFSVDEVDLYQDVGRTTPAGAGDPVRSFVDAKGNVIVAPSDAERMVYQTDGTYHWLETDGVDDHMTGFPVHGANRTIGVAVLTPTGGMANGIVYGARTSADLRSYISTSETGATIRAGVGSDSVVDSLTASLDAPHSAVMTHDGTDVTLCVDGGAVATTSQPGSTTPGAEAYLGVLNNGGSAQAGTYFKGRIYAVVDVARVVTASERANINAWLMHKAGVS